MSRKRCGIRQKNASIDRFSPYSYNEDKVQDVKSEKRSNNEKLYS